MGLTEKQRRFADNYIKTGNAKQSAIDAGYSVRTAKSIGQENLTKPDLRKYIDDKMAEIESHKIMDATEALQTLTGIARGEITETVFNTTADGVFENEKSADLKTRISAIKEILKRYPGSDKLLDAQIRKIQAEADIAEARASAATSSHNGQMDKLDEILTVITEEVNEHETSASENEGDKVGDKQEQATSEIQFETNVSSETRTDQ